jgi:hypothetical protein
MDIQNAIFGSIFIFIIYTLATEYFYYAETDPFYITSKTDFHKYESEGRYDDSELYNKYKKMKETDKIFFRDLICHEILNYKDERPNFKKRCKTISRNIFLSTFGSYIFLNSSIAKTLKQNTLGYFMTNMI